MCSLTQCSGDIRTPDPSLLELLKEIGGGETLHQGHLHTEPLGVQDLTHPVECQVVALSGRGLDEAGDIDWGAISLVVWSEGERWIVALCKHRTMN